MIYGGLKQGPGEEDDMTRKELEQRLYDLRYDMDCIADGGQELRQAIACLTDEELTEAIRGQEED